MRLLAYLFFFSFSSQLLALQGFQAPLPRGEVEKHIAALFPTPDTQSIDGQGLREFFEGTLVINEGEGGRLILDNGSEWLFNCIWSWKTHPWQPGDKLLISHHPSNLFLPVVRMENTTRDSVAWGELFKAPDRGKEATLQLQEILHGSFLIFNRGLSAHTEASIWIDHFKWKPGDTVLLMPHPGDKSRYDIWNFTTNTIIADLPLDGLCLN